MEASKKVWLVTGVSGGLGRTLAEAVYHRGDIIIGTVRKQEDKTAFEQAFPDRAAAYLLDMTDLKGITAVVAEVVRVYGRIDVLINNAGYGLFGPVEELTDDAVQHQIAVNFTGLWKMTQSVLPAMRAQRSGHIIQISSRAGIAASAGNGLYAASKFAVEGLSEALAAEVGPFGIHVTLVEPGALRTNFFGETFTVPQTNIEDYRPLIAKTQELINRVNGHQPGDPQKSAQLIVSLADMDAPPFRLPLTAGAIDTLEQKIKAYQEVTERWSAAAKSIEYQS